MPRSLLLLSVLLAACPTAPNDDDSVGDDDDSVGDDDDSVGDDDDSVGDDDDSVADDDDSVGDDDDSVGDDDDSQEDVFGGGAPGAGNFTWTGPPTIAPAECFGEGPHVGNGYILSGVDPVARTFSLQPDNGGQRPAAPCTYELDGDFACAVQETFDMAVFGTVGIITIESTHVGTFVDRLMSIDGSNHAFSPSWAFDVVSTYTGSCTGTPQDCNFGAQQGFSWLGFPCTTAITAGTFSFDDPTLP